MILLSLLRRQHPDEKGEILLNFSEETAKPWEFTVAFHTGRCCRVAQAPSSLFINHVRSDEPLCSAYRAVKKQQLEDKNPSVPRKAYSQQGNGKGDCDSFHLIHSSPASYQLHPNQVQEPRARSDPVTARWQTQNHRMVWAGRDLRDHPTPLGRNTFH